MERSDNAGIAGLFSVAAASASAGGELALDQDAAHHIRVRRLVVGDEVRVTDGAGRLIWGRLSAVRRDETTVAVERVDLVTPTPRMRLLVPVADRERMLWLAEKSAELGLAVWQPIMWRRSRSVSSRGEGPAFAARVRSRMSGALAQSGGAWLPEIRDSLSLRSLIETLGGESRLMLDAAGSDILAAGVTAPVVMALGPEGGFEPDERSALLAAGFEMVSLAANVLRFETAGVAALAVLGAMLVPREAANLV